MSVAMASFSSVRRSTRSTKFLSRSRSTELCPAGEAPSSFDILGLQSPDAVEQGIDRNPRSLVAHVLVYALDVGLVRVHLKHGVDDAEDEPHPHHGESHRADLFKDTGEHQNSSEADPTVSAPSIGSKAS